MATSTIEEKFVIKNKKATKQLEKAYENRVSIADVEPFSAEEKQKGKEIAIKWLSHQSKN